MSDPVDDRALAAARLWVAHRFPYLTTALFATSVVPAPGLGGVAVDASWRLYVDPAVLRTWSVAELGVLLVHHVGHLVRDHAGRAAAAGVPASAAADWTTACDAELNDDLLEMGLDLPHDAVTPAAIGQPAGRFAEEYYGALDAASPRAHEHGSGVHGHRRPWEHDGEPHLAPHERRLARTRVAHAIVAGSGAGRVPGAWRRWAASLLRPVADWRVALAAEVRRGLYATVGRVDYSYRRPSRRAPVAGGVVLPSLVRPDVPVAIVCDTSASMTAPLLEQAVAEVDGVLAAVGVRSSTVPVVAADAAAHVVRRVRSSRQVELRGGGGTDMRAAIGAAAALRPAPRLVVVLTDGVTPWPATPPPGVRVVVGLVRAPWRPEPSPPPAWARVVRIDVGGRS